MANSILDAVMNLLGPRGTTALADRTGISLTSLRAGIGTSISALLEEIATRSGDSDFMVRVFNMARNFSSTDLLNLLHLSPSADSAPATEQGTQIAGLLLGDRQSAVESSIANRVGLSIPTSRQLLAVAAPLTIGVLGQKIQSQGLNLFSFSQIIRSQAVSIEEHLSGRASAQSVPAVPDAAASLLAPTRRSKGIWNAIVVLGLLALGLLIWLLVRGCNDQESASAPPEHPTVSAPLPLPALGPLGKFVDRKLPDGMTLHIPELGIENRFINFIEDSSRPVDTTTWFDFDRLTFDTGSATLQPSSSEQLQNIAMILKAYPNVQTKIGGYTDNTGNKDANLKLSEARARNVMEELVARGTTAARLEAKGYGEEHPVADNATEEGRQRNRRTSLLVTAKQEIHGVTL